MNPSAPTLALSTHQQPSVDGRWQGSARVLGMYCGACSLDLEAQAKQIAGLDRLEVNPATGMAFWVASNPLAIEVLVRRIQRQGYQLCPTQGGEDAREQLVQHAQLQQRRLLLRALIALLCMMQIMMYSAPEYLYPPEQIGMQALQLLRWAQWVLALPLLVYCAQPFLQRALQAALRGRLVMDQTIALGLVLAFGVSSAQMHNAMAPVWFDSMAMLLALLLSVQWLTQRRVLQALQALLHTPVDFPTTLMRRSAQAGETTWQPTPVLQLAAGDCFALPAHTACPVDALVLAESAPLWVDEAVRSGEATPVLKRAGDTVLAGARLLGQPAVLQTLRGHQHSSFAQLGKALQRALAQKPKHRSLVEALLPHFVLAVLLAAAFSAGVWMLLGHYAQAWAVAVAVLLVSCPCALALAQPLVRLLAMQALRRVGVLVRNPEALDVLAKTSCFAFDKTGTLAPHHAATVHSTVLQQNPLCPLPVVLQMAGQLAQASQHPVAMAIHAHLLMQTGVKNPNQAPCPLARVQEQPGSGLQANCSWQGQALQVRLGSATWCGIDEALLPKTSASQAYCVVSSLPGGSLPAAEVLGSVRFELQWPALAQKDQQALQALRKLGRLALLSGDHEAAVHAWQTHIAWDERLAGLQAHDKQAWVQAQQRQGHVVLMVGDGLNDSTAFATADAAVAVQGASGLAAAQADCLLETPHTAWAVQQAVCIARQAQRLGKQNLAWALGYNLLALPLAASGLLSPWMAALGMGLSSLGVLLNAWRVQA